MLTIQTVGVAGGLPGGGGHGPLTTLKGWAVDNALEFSVITAGGDYITANTNSHPDLFWALRGGGPGNYVAILTVTYKTTPTCPAAA
jgi:FAD/FMN-containing dehydrogenase